MNENETLQKQLTEKLEYYHTLFENAPLGCQSLDVNGNIIEVNKTWCQLLGYSKEAVLGKNFSEFIHPDLRERFKEQFLKNKGVGNILGVEFKMIKQDGSEIIVSFDSKVEYHEDGSLKRIHGMFQDITEHRRAADTQQVLLSISEASYKAKTLSQLLKTIHRSLSNIMDVTNFYVALHDAESDLYTFPFIVDRHDDDEIPVEQMKTSLTDYVRRNKQPLLVDSEVSDRLRREGEVELIGEESRVWMGAPLIIHDDVIGVVAIQSYSDAQAYTQADLDTLVIVSSHIAEAIERKRANEILRESEDKFRTLYDASTDAVMLLDHEGIFDCNNAAPTIFGFSSKEEFCSKHPVELAPPKQPGGVDSKILAREHIDTALQKGSCRFEWTYQRLDGTQFPCEVLLTPMVLNEKQILQAVVRDISERKNNEAMLRQRENELRDIFSAIQVGIVLIDTETRKIVNCNPAVLSMINATEDQVIGSMCHEFICPSHKDQCVFLDYHESIDQLETELITIDDEMVPILKTVSRITLNKKEYLLETLVDISGQKKAELERQGLELEINQSRKLEAVGSLASGIAHEINTPIQFVGDNTNFLSDSFKSLIALIEAYENLWQQATAGSDLASLDAEKVKAEERADLEYIRGEVPAAIEQTLEGVKRVTKIVRAMKDFAHSDQGTKSRSDLNDMLASTLTVAHNELKYVAEVEIDFDRDLPEVECYRDDLNQVFLNLLVNAAHAIADVVGDASAGKGIITVATLHDSEYVIARISDTGTGIPEAVRNRIFDPFFSTKDVGKGSGQGLAIARKIVVDKHGGRLDFETEEGKGTTFIIRLPLVSQEEAVEVS